jgi:hypothetical protein
MPIQQRSSPAKWGRSVAGWGHTRQAKRKEPKICTKSSLSPQLYAGFCRFINVEAVRERVGERGFLGLAGLSLTRMGEGAVSKSN